MTEMWRFLLGAKPCDICTPMANHYPYPPHVPVHPKCDCTVEQIPSHENCTTELRKFESTEVKYSDTQVHTADLFNDSPNDVQASIPVEMGSLTESWEDPRLPSKLGWNPPSGTQPLAVNLSHGSNRHWAVERGSRSRRRGRARRIAGSPAGGAQRAVGGFAACRLTSPAPGRRTELHDHQPADRCHGLSIGPAASRSEPG